MTHVAIVKGENRRQNIIEVLNNLPDSAWQGLGQAKSILIKPNLVHHKNQLASTHVDAVRGVIEIIRQKTDALITIADSSYHGTKAAFRHFGYENLPNEYRNVQLFDLNDDETVQGYYMKRDGSKGKMGFSKLVKNSDFTICLAQMKTHRDVGVSLSVKNWTVGTWVPKPRFGAFGKYWPRWPYLHAEGNFAHNSTIAELLHQLKPNLAIIDGFLAMEGDGPTLGEPVQMNLALAGTDSVAVDLVACEIMGINTADIGYLAMAGQRGYGINNKSQISIIGESDLSNLKRTFTKPDTWNHNVLAWKK